MGGIADSKWSGIKNSLYRFIGWDPHSVPGILRVAQKLTKDSGSVVTEFCKVRLVCSNGCTYWFSSTTGKVWERTSAGVWSFVYTMTAAAGGVIPLGAFEFDGYIYIGTESRVHKIIATSIGATQWTANMTLNWETFTKTDALFHPMFELNEVLYIGDGNLIAQVGDTGIFTADALDINEPLRVKCLGQMGVDLLVGTWVANNITKTQIYRWNTYSDSWTVSDTIDEVGINAFLEADNYQYVSCGLAGNIYQFDGEKLWLYKKIPGDYSSTKQSIVNPNAVANIEGQILFGVSNVNGNPCDQGVYRIGRNSMTYPYILDFPYPVSQRNSGALVLTNVEVGAVLVAGSDVLVSWKDSTGSPAYGVDKIDWSNKLDGAFFESRIIRVSRDIFNNFSKFIVAYALLPASTAIAIAYNKNYGSYVDTTEVVDTDKNIIISDSEGVEATTLQLRVTATVNGNDAPEVESATAFIR